MINPFVLKKYLAFLIIAAFSTCSFFFILMTIKVLIYAILGMVVFTLLGSLLASKLLETPFSLMLEGKGIMTFDIDSPGIIRPFIMQLKKPYIEGSLDGDQVSDIFDRETVYNLAVPQYGGSAQQVVQKDGTMRIDIQLSEEEYNKGRFAFFHYPCIIYNAQIKSIVTKDFLSEKEKYLFAEHTILYLNRKMEELTNHMRDFARYVVEQFRPKNVGLNIPTWLIWIFLVILFGVLIYFLGPKIFPALAPAANAASQAGNAMSHSVNMG